MGVSLAGPGVGEGDVGRNDGAGSPFHPRPRGCSWQPFHCKNHPKPCGAGGIVPKTLPGDTGDTSGSVSFCPVPGEHHPVPRDHHPVPMRVGAGGWDVPKSSF